MAYKFNLIVDSGATFITTFDVINMANAAINLSLYTGNCQIRKYYGSNTSYPVSVTLSNTGIITLSMTANQTANIAAGRYAYDVKLTDQTFAVSRIVEGIVTVTPHVTT